MNNNYSEDFYEQSRQQGIRASSVAREMLSGLGLNVDSVVDVGGGVGGWLEPWEGISGSRVLIDLLPPDVANRVHFGITYLESDLETMRGVPDLECFDLGICVEVAEHLSEAAALRVLDYLAKVTDLIIWSAAWPGQGGEQHINEKPPAYWYSQLQARGYLVIDVLRKELAVHGSPSYYCSNVVLAARRIEHVELIAKSGTVHYLSSIGIPDARTTRQKVLGLALKKFPVRGVSAIARLKNFHTRHTRSSDPI
jgi:hypothetical protein